MSSNLFTGKLVRLAAADASEMAKALARWGHNSEFMRFLDSEAPVLWSEKKFQEWLEKDDEDPGHGKLFFQVRRLEDNRLLGFVELGTPAWSRGEAWVGIGLGEREDWGHGYGTDAMQLILRYAFTELNLHRVSLDVFDYNPRAIRSYEKAGFKVEGCVRQAMQREGRRWDYVYMGLLRREWEAMQEEK